MIGRCDAATMTNCSERSNLLAPTRRRPSPLVRSDDAELSYLLDELTWLPEHFADPQTRRHPAHLLSRQLHLQRLIAERERTRTPAAQRYANSDVITLAELRSALAGRRLVELDVIHGRLIAVIVDGSRTRRLDIGPSASISALFDAAGLALEPPGA